MRASERLYRTTEGELVAEGNPAAAFLAYAEGDDIDAADEERVPGAKTRKQSENKMAAKPEDKSDNETPKAADVRAWAEEQGLEVPARGKLPDKVVEAYRKREH